MSRKLIPLTLMATLLGGTALAETPRVAVDIGPVHSLVARVLEGISTPDLIVQIGASPHEYSLRPSEAAALQNADLVFWIDADLTPWLSDTIETLAPDAAVTSLLEADGTFKLEFRESALFEAHAHDDHDDYDDHDHEGHDDHHEDDDHHDDDDDRHDDHDDRASGEFDEPVKRLFLNRNVHFAVLMFSKLCVLLQERCCLLVAVLTLPEFGLLGLTSVIQQVI